MEYDISQEYFTGLSFSNCNLCLKLFLFFNFFFNCFVFKRVIFLRFHLSSAYNCSCLNTCLKTHRIKNMISSDAMLMKLSRGYKKLCLLSFTESFLFVARILLYSRKRTLKFIKCFLTIFRAEQLSNNIQHFYLVPSDKSMEYQFIKSTLTNDIQYT